MADITVDIDISARVNRPWSKDLDANTRVIHVIMLRAETQLIVHCNFERYLPTRQAIHEQIGFSGDVVAVITHRTDGKADTRMTVFGAHISRSDTVQRIAIPAGLLADTRQILFAVLIDQDHEIQT